MKHFYVNAKIHINKVSYLMVTLRPLLHFKLISRVIMVFSKEISARKDSRRLKKKIENNSTSEGAFYQSE